MIGLMQATTIYALSTGPAPTGVAIIRVSGPAVEAILKSLCGFVPKPRRAVLAALHNPETKALIDEALVLYFKGPASFTGEDVAEFHIHGGRAVIAALLETLSHIPNCQMAERGEFSRRGFFNGKLDLMEVEGLADLIAAETDAQRRQALNQMQGAQSKFFETLREKIIHAIAMVDSALDFSDEADVPEEIAGAARPLASDLLSEIERYLDDGNRGEILREGFHVVLAGLPNAGKSRLLNALAARDVAIVSEEAGTTRDIIEVRLDIDGVPVRVTDTAGLRETESLVEKEGIRRSFAQLEMSELAIWIIDGTAPQLVPEDVIERCGGKVMSVWNKVDVSPVPKDFANEIDFEISAETGLGLEALLSAIGARALERVGQGEGAIVTRARHRDLLELAAAQLREFLEGDLSDTELRAEDLRRAAFAIGRLTGKVDVEDVLDKIFLEFCIGK